METITRIIMLYEDTVIHNLFIAFLVIELISRFFIPKVYKTSKQITRWLVISYGAMATAIWLISIAIDLPERATGKYAAVYWLLMFFSCLLPFILVFKRLKHSRWAIFFVVLLLNFAVGIEWLTTSASSGSGTSIGFSFTPLRLLFLRGICLAIFITAVSLVVIKYRKTNANDIKAL